MKRRKSRKSKGTAGLGQGKAVGQLDSWAVGQLAVEFGIWNFPCYLALNFQAMKTLLLAIMLSICFIQSCFLVFNRWK